MRDRTIILLALLFLVLSIGAGVNKSLAAGNKTLGRQMAPSIDQIFKQQAPLVLEGVKKITAYGKTERQAVRRQYLVLAREFEVLKAGVSRRITDVLVYWRGKFSSHLTEKMIYY